MLDFEFMSPTQFVFGRGVEEKVGGKLAERGAKKVLLHFGGQSAEAGSSTASARRSTRRASSA